MTIIGTIGNTVLLFLSFKPSCGEIVPAQLGTEAVPNHKVALVRPPAVFETPLQDLFVGAALQDAITKIGIVYPQKITASAINRSLRAEILVIIFVQLSAGMQPNLVQHSREIDHSARHLFRTFRIGRHAQINLVMSGGAILDTIFTGNRSEKCCVSVMIGCAEDRTQIRQFARSRKR